MPRATIPGGKLVPIQNCYILIPGANVPQITLNNLPDISDGKSASYNDEAIMGRSFPLKTYSHSENRNINLTLHFFTINKGDAATNLQYLRALESAVYPRTAASGLPFLPPPVCKIMCGKLLADQELCVVLRSYSVKFGTDVAWDADTYLPYKFDVETQWDVVYRSSDLPGQERILSLGR
jgi:hypothetical protein